MFIGEEIGGKAPCAANLLLPEPSGASAENKSLPGPSVLETDESNMIQLMDMFPEKGRDELVHALQIYGTISRTALSLSSSTVHNIDDSSDDDPTGPTHFCSHFNVSVKGAGERSQSRKTKT